MNVSQPPKLKLKNKTPHFVHTMISNILIPEIDL